MTIVMLMRMMILMRMMMQTSDVDEDEDDKGDAGERDDADDDNDCSYPNVFCGARAGGAASTLASSSNHRIPFKVTGDRDARSERFANRAHKSKNSLGSPTLRKCECP